MARLPGAQRIEVRHRWDLTRNGSEMTDRVKRGAWPRRPDNSVPRFSVGTGTGETFVQVNSRPTPPGTTNFRASGKFSGSRRAVRRGRVAGATQGVPQLAAALLEGALDRDARLPLARGEARPRGAGP